MKYTRWLASRALPPFDRRTEGKKAYEKDKIYACLYQIIIVPLRQAYRFVFALGIVAEILLRLVAHPEKVERLQKIAAESPTRRGMPK